MAELEIPHPDGLSQLPAAQVAGVYFLWYGAKIVYVGQSRHIQQRICEHIQDGVKCFDGLSYIEVSPSKILQVERYYIERLLPKYNRCSISDAMRKLRKQGFGGVTVASPGRRNGPLWAADYLGISVDSLVSLNLSEEIKVRVPRGNFRRRITRWRLEVLREWAEENPDTHRLLQSKAALSAFEGAPAKSNASAGYSGLMDCARSA